jgi:hypothetical protein
MGLIAIGIAWAMVVPVIRVRTLRENSDFGFSLFNIFLFFNKLSYYIFTHHSTQTPILKKNN